jgi:ABC-2 type transport system ATP-binding protein
MNRALYDLPRKEADETLATLIELLEAGDLVGKPTRQLSLGERMKCELVAALLHRPKVLFLDEPTIGLDVSMQARIRQFIREYNERFGATVILTSHYMEDVAALCPRVVVIDKGRIIYDGELKDLVRRIRPEKRITIRLSAPADPQKIDRLGVVTSRTDEQVVLLVPVTRVNETLRDALQVLAVADLAVEDPPLEEVMRELFKKGGAGKAEPHADATASP